MRMRFESFLSVVTIAVTGPLLVSGFTSMGQHIITKSDGISTRTKVSTSTERMMINMNDAGDGNEELSDNIPSRRDILTMIAGAYAAVGNVPTARAGLLDEFGADPGKIEQKKVEVEPPSGVKKGDAAIDPTLRASYYYPTAKKRYLPRIQKVTEEIAKIPDCIYSDDWDSVNEFAKRADNAILPLQLYVSSLDGQGLGMTNSYAAAMRKDAKEFEQQYKVLMVAIKKKDKDTALGCVTAMGVAVADYRQQGRLKDDDGNIPSVEEIKRSTIRRL